MIYASKNFWIAVLERAIKTAAQAAVLAGGAFAFTNVGEVVTLFSALFYAAFGGALLSVLTSIGSGAIGDNGPSLTKEFVDQGEWTGVGA